MRLSWNNKSLQLQPKQYQLQKGQQKILCYLLSSAIWSVAIKSTTRFYFNVIAIIAVTMQMWRETTQNYYIQIYVLLQKFSGTHLKWKANFLF